jgi:hypothetical protein
VDCSPLDPEQRAALEQAGVINQRSATVVRDQLGRARSVVARRIACSTSTVVST